MNLLQTVRNWLNGLTRPPAPPVPIPPFPVTPTHPQPSPAPNTPEEELLSAHNQARYLHQLPPLKHSYVLTTKARSHASWMARNQELTHDNDGTFRARLRDYYGLRIGENIAHGQRTVTEVTTAWMNSPGHAANVLGDYTEVGFGMSAGSDGQLYWCADFGTPLVTATPLSAARNQEVSLPGPLETPAIKHPGE